MVSGCAKEVVPQDPASAIQIQPDVADRTKSLLFSGDLATDGSVVKVYDFIDGFVGELNGATNPTRAQYFADEVQYVSSSSSWEFVSGAQWSWTKTGTHNFIGWTVKDNRDGLTSKSLWGDGTTDVTLNQSNLSNIYITVPFLAFTTATAQFDFSFSSFVQATSGTVNLPMKHLFSAISIWAENSMVDKSVTIKSIKFDSGMLKNGSSAEISTDGTVTRYNKMYSSEFFSSPSPFTLAARGSGATQKYDVLSKAANPSERAYFLIWPQTQDEVGPTTTNPNYVAPTVNENTGEVTYSYNNYTNAYGDVVPDTRLYNSTDSLIIVKYRIEGDTRDRISRAKIPSGWDAGSRYALSLLFADKMMTLKLEVAPWDYSYTPTDFKQSSVTVLRDIQWEGAGTTYSQTGNTLNILNQSSVTGEFLITNPIGGSWRVAAVPYFGENSQDYFTITQQSSAIDPTNENGLARFTITPRNAASKVGRKAIKLKFIVLDATDREVDLTGSDLNRNDYIISWD